MEWIQSEHRIKHELYNKKKGYINYNTMMKLIRANVGKLLEKV